MLTSIIQIKKKSTHLTDAIKISLCSRILSRKIVSFFFRRKKRQGPLSFPFLFFFAIHKYICIYTCATAAASLFLLLLCNLLLYTYTLTKLKREARRLMAHYYIYMYQASEAWETSKVSLARIVLPKYPFSRFSSSCYQHFFFFFYTY